LGRGQTANPGLTETWPLKWCVQKLAQNVQCNKSSTILRGKKLENTEVKKLTSYT